MAAGFVTTAPVARLGDTWNALGTYNHDCVLAFKFVCGGTGTFNVTEMGIYVQQPDATPPALQMAIFTHDAVNDCPDIIVANSQTGTIGGAAAAWYHGHLASCQVVGGVTYWICFLEGQEDEISCLDGTGAGLWKSGLTPYTFSTGDAWHTHTNLTAWTPDVYALIVSATTTSTSTTTTTSTSTSTTTSTTLAPTGGWAFGEQNPNQGETGVSWTTWKKLAGTTVTVTGDADWGQLTISSLGDNAEGRSPVYNTGGGNKTITISKDRYAAGNGTVTMQYRSSDTKFYQNDTLPAWTTYTVPVVISTRYLQVRVID